MKEKIELNQKDFEFICPVKSEDMDAIVGGYFCHDCEKKVYDVSDYTQDEFQALTSTKRGLCVNFKKIVTTSLILNATLCVATDTTKSNRLAPLKVTANQTVSFEHKKVVELGGGFAPVTIFEVDGNVSVPIEPVETPPRNKDENRTKDKESKRV
jgi:hypothetical protein